MLANNLNRGFTILEMVLVIAILSGLLGLGIYSFRPTTLFNDANKIKSDLEVGLINNALKAYYSEKGRYPDVFNSISSGTYEICRYNLEPCPTAGINLDILVDEKFIPEIPIRSYDNPNFTGYKVLYLSTADNYERDYYLAFASDGDLAQVVIPTPSSPNADNALLSGRVGGQTLHGGKEAGENLTLRSTSNASKGKIFFGTSAYDEANDRLGVGNTSPGSRLVVKGISATSATSALNVLNSAETSALFVRDDRNVGIGTTSPNANLEIAHNGAGTFGVALRLNQNTIGNSDGPKIAFNKTMTASKKWTAGILDGVNVGDFAISEDGDYTGGFGTPRLTVRAGGNVGIGTTSPGAGLEILKTTNGTTNELLRLSNSGLGTGTGGALTFANFNAVAGQIKTVYGANSTWSMGLGTVGNLDTVTLKTGNVGIGTTSPGAKLEVFNDVNNSHFMYINNPNTSAQASSSIAFSAGTTIGEVVVTNQSYNYSNNYGTEANTLQLINRGAGPLIFKTAGYLANAERMRITSAGNVGIGTASPGYKLDVFTSTTNDGAQIRIKNAYAAGGGSANAVVNIDGYGASELKIWRNGFEEWKLERVQNTDDLQLNAYGGAVSGGAGAGVVQFWDYDTGNIGIGTAAPGNTLTIGQNTASNNTDYSLSVLRHGTLAAPGTYTANTPAIAVIDISGDGPATAETQALLNVNAARIADTDTYAANAMLFNVQNDTGSAFTIKGNRNVGIGTASPESTLDVRGNLTLGASVANSFTLKSASAGSNTSYVEWRNGTTRQAYMGWQPSYLNLQLENGYNFGIVGGNVGIGTSSPGSHRLSVLGTAGLSSGTAWTNTSDSRLKNVETNLKESSILDKLLKLNPVSFRWNDLHNSLYGSDKTKLNYGFVAQEVEPIFPDMITTDENGYKWYNPSGFEAVLTASIQSQQTQITSNTQKVAEVANDLKDVQQKLEILTNKIEPKVIFNSKSGTTVLSESKTSVFVQTTEIRIDSLVMVTSETVIPYALAVTEKVPNQGFRVEIPESAQKDIKFSWLII